MSFFVQDNIDNIQPFGPRLLVRRYERPERSSGGIILAWRKDTSGSLWELIRISEDAEKKLGMSFSDDANYIIQTPMLSGVHLGDDYFILHVEEVVGVFPYEAEEEECAPER